MELPEVQLLTTNGNVAFRNGAWSDAFPDIAVFDGTYISENVFVGDVVDTETDATFTASSSEPKV
jgi:hypothetical protein